MANMIQWGATGTSRSTGIAAADNFANASGLLSSEIDNSANLDRWLTLQWAFDAETAPAAQAPFTVYILYAVDGSNYEDGGTSLEAAKAPVWVCGARAVDTAQKMTSPPIEIQPYKFKVLVWNATAQQHDGCTLLAYTYNEEVQ